MKSLATLIKWQKTQVDEQRQLLTKLQTQLERIEGEIAQLEIRQAREQLAVQQNPEQSLTYGEFLRYSIRLARELEKQRQAAAKAIELAQDKLASLFEEQKRYELAEESRKEKAKREENRRETAQFDEIGSVSFVRRKKRKAK